MKSGYEFYQMNPNDRKHQVKPGSVTGFQLEHSKLERPPCRLSGVATWYLQRPSKTDLSKTWLEHRQRRPGTGSYGLLQYLILTREFTRCSPSSSCGSSSYWRCCCFCQGEIRNDTKRYDSPAPSQSLFEGFRNSPKKTWTSCNFSSVVNPNLRWAQKWNHRPAWDFCEDWSKPFNLGVFHQDPVGKIRPFGDGLDHPPGSVWWFWWCQWLTGSPHWSLQPSQVWFTNHEPTNQIWMEQESPFDSLIRSQ